MGLRPHCLPGLLLLLATLGRCQLSIGTPQWGFDLIIPQQMQQCVPYRIFYNITDVHQPSRTYPGSGAVSFLTPDTSAQEWMVLTPPMGAGYLSWTPTIAAGKAFAISVPGLSGYSQVFTIQSGPSSCLPASGAAQTTASTYGSLNVAVYKEMTTQSLAVSGAGNTPFNGANYPAGSFITHAVPLGVLIAEPTRSADSAPTMTPTLTLPGHSASPAPVSTGTLANTQSSDPTPPAVSGGTASSSVAPGSSAGAGDGHPSGTDTSENSSAGAPDSSSPAPRTSGSSTPGPAVTVVASTTHVPAGAIAGGVFSALVLGLVAGVAVMLVRRRAARCRKALRTLTAPRPVWLEPRDMAAPFASSVPPCYDRPDSLCPPSERDFADGEKAPLPVIDEQPKVPTYDGAARHCLVTMLLPLTPGSIQPPTYTCHAGE